VAEACGGCPLIGTSYADQLRSKERTVRDALVACPSLAGRIDPCLPAEHPLAYRNRAKLAVRDVGGRARIGLHRRGTNEVVDLAPCRVQRPVLQEAIERVRGWLDKHRLAHPTGRVFYVDLREAAGGRAHVTLVLAGESPAEERLPLQALVEGWPACGGLALNFGSPDSSYPLGPRTVARVGPERFPAPLPRAGREPLRFEVPATGFFQVNAGALEPVHRLMAEHLGRGDLLDLYCGVGVHGLALAGAGTEVVGIESSARLVDAARANARACGVAARYVAGRVEELLGTVLGERRCDRVILNPGRSGCRPAVVDALAGHRPARLAYLSCNPDTLARDLARFERRGILAIRAIPLDLMPQTEQVEALALLTGD
jgi:23S rRNA (uracil1939-C5)-methyltransferase